MVTFAAIAGAAVLLVLLWAAFWPEREDRTVPIRWEERRTFFRVVPPRSMPVEVQLMGEDFLEVLEVRDISVGGLGVCVPDRFAGTDTKREIDLIVTLPGQKPMQIRGMVRHGRSQGGSSIVFGVQFSRVSDEQKTRIADYVERARARVAEDANVLQATGS